MIKRLIPLFLALVPHAGLTQAAYPSTYQSERELTQEQERRFREAENRRTRDRNDGKAEVLRLLQSPTFGGWLPMSSGYSDTVQLTRSIGDPQDAEFEALTFVLSPQLSAGIVNCIVAPCPGQFHESLTLHSVKVTEIQCKQGRSRTHLLSLSRDSVTPQAIAEAVMSGIDSDRRSYLSWNPSGTIEKAVCTSRGTQ